MTKFLNWRGWFGLILSVLALSPFAVAADESIPLDPAVRTGKLPNGLTYYIRKNRKPEKRVELRLAVDTGSVQEDDDQLGLAHLVEHLCFAGTKSFPKVELIHYLQSIGAGFGADINAHTGFDETVYQLSLPADSPEILANGLKIMKEWAHDVTFDPTEIDRERGVVVEEWRLGRGASQRMRDKYLPVLLKDSKYANRLPIGTKESIEGMSYDTIKRYYHDWYRPDNMAFVIVGDIDPDQIEAAVREQFGSIPAATKPRPKEAYPVPNHEQPLYSIVSDRENANNVALVFFKTEVEHYHTLADYRRRLTENLYVELLNARLEEMLQQANPPFLNAGVGYGRFGVRSKAAYTVYALVAENGLERGMTALLTENERVHQHGFTAAELEREKRSMLKNLEQRHLEQEKTESSRLVETYVRRFLDDEPAPGIEFEYTFAKDHLGEITLEEVNRLAGEWITAKNRVAVAQAVEKPAVKIPTEAELQKVIQEVSAAKVEPYKEKQLAASLLAQKPAAGKVTATKTVEKIGVTELTLSNGVRVVLKPSTFKNDEILFSAYREGGQSVFPDNYKLSAMMADECVVESGVGEFSKADLVKMLAGKVVNVSPQLSTYYEGVRGNCSVADLETALQLSYLYFTQPRRDETAYASLIERRKAQLKNILSNPTYAFFNDMQQIRYNHHPRNPRVLPTEKEWADVSLDKMMEVYRNRFGNAAGYTFEIVGAFTVDGIKPLLETYLASLPAAPGAAGYKDLGLRSIEGPFDQKIVHGTDPKSMALISLEGPVEYSRDDTHIFWSLGNVLQRVLIDRLRIEMSGVYSPRATAGIDRVPYAHYVFEVTIPCAPDNVDKLTTATYEEIKKIQTNGVKPEDLTKEIETQRRTVEKDLQDNGAWLRKLEMIYRNGETFGRLSDPDELIKLVTAENLQKAATKYLTTEKAVRFTLYPESKPSAEVAPSPAKTDPVAKEAAK